MNSATVSLDSLEKFIEEGARDVALPAWLEDHFERDTRKHREAFLRDAALKTSLIYNLLFTICSWLLVPDMLTRAVAVNFGLVTPWTLVVAWAVGRGLPARIREALAASIPVSIALEIAYLYCATISPDASHVLYFVLLTIIIGNTALRLRYANAVASSACALACVVASILAGGKTQVSVAVVQWVMLSTGAYATLIMNQMRERDVRRAYLRALRDRLKLADADARANKDALTDLGNRHHLAARATALWAAGAGQSPVAAVMLDIDHFKEFNDHYGHPAGDACLKRVAACVTAELRSLDDFAVRYGGEELLLVLPRTELVDAIRVAERIRRAIEALGVPHSGGGPCGIVTASFGVASAPVAALTFDELISAADTALYAAKRGGRNQVCPPPLREAKIPVARPGWASALKRRAG